MAKRNNYKIILNMLGKEYKSQGETAFEAMDNLNLSWEQIKGKGVITLFKDKKSHEHLFYLRPLKRIFANKLTKLMWVKRLELLLNNETATMKVETDL